MTNTPAPVTTAVERPILWLVVHTCGAYDAKAKQAVHQSVNDVRRYHMTPVIHGGKGWSDIGYHRYIEQDGTLRSGRRDAVVGAHVGGFNSHSLGICCSGHGDYEPFNPRQLATLVKQLVEWCNGHRLGPGAVLGHRETDDHGGPKVWKTCPGTLVDMDELRALVGAALNASRAGA